ncbi:MAG TPA: DUF692 family protein [bacterium]|nr:DUF692 family protein [bacterium]
MVGVRDDELVRRLLAAGEIGVDFLETGGPRAATAPAVPGGAGLLVHNAVWNWSLAHPRALELPGVLSTIREVAARTGTPWISTHLGFACAEVAPDGRMMMPRSPVLARDDVRASIVRTARGLAAALRVPLLLENLDYWPTGAYEYVSEPAFVADVLAEAGVEFLLDLAHAQVAAARLGLPVDDYVARLPLKRVREIHVSGPRLREGGLIDAHDSLTDEDYRLLGRVLAASRPAAVTFEYHGADGSAVAAELARLRTVLGV